MVKDFRAAESIDRIPYRLALAGGWIDQPFVSRFDPSPPGSMVVVGLEPLYPFMDRAGMAISTRKAALRLWGGSLPARDPAGLVRELYAEENKGKPDPSGSQDMIGIIHPGINRLDYDFLREGGVFPVHIETCRDPEIGSWLEKVLHIIPVAPRPEGYDPLGKKKLDPAWVRKLGRSGWDCFVAIRAKDVRALGASLNECMACWRALLPLTVVHPALRVDLTSLLRHYQDTYEGAMFSGCGGGYLFVVSERPVPGSFHVKIRLGDVD
jgi:hypothetical protein